MNDLVARLRSDTPISISHQAADAIEALQAEVAEWKAKCAERNGVIERMKMEIKGQAAVLKVTNEALLHCIALSNNCQEFAREAIRQINELGVE